MALHSCLQAAASPLPLTWGLFLPERRGELLAVYPTDKLVCII